MTCLAHHWLIDAPAGAVSEAVCRDCGATRTFSNVFNEQRQVGQIWPQERKRVGRPKEEPKDCSVTGCLRPMRAQGLCDAHYKQQKRRQRSVVLTPLTVPR